MSKGSRRLAEAGQAIAWVAVMMPFFLSIVGLTIDGGVVLDYRRELQNAADSAARAGVMQIDQQAYRDSGEIVLDQAEARQVAGEYLVERNVVSAATITVDQRRVLVQVSRDVPTSFLRIVGIQTVRISASSSAEARAGIAGPGS